MSLPAADLPAPIAVLVLAWDEATPAVRALVEATQAPAPTVDSILVMVPQADAPDHLSAEEYLPLALAEAEVPVSIPEVLAAPALKTEPPLAATEPAATLASAAEAEQFALVAEAQPTETDSAESVLLPVAAPLAGPNPAPPAEPVAPLAWAAVRVLRLGSQSLSQLAQRAGQPLPAPIWAATAALPAAPYVGATPPAGLQPALPQSPALLPTLPLPATSQGSPSTIALPGALPHSSLALPTPMPGAGPSQPASSLPLAEATEPRSQAADLEADFLIAEAEGQVRLETASPAPTTVGEKLPWEATSPDPVPADEPVLPAEQAGWPEALAALRQPATLPVVPEPEPMPDAASIHPALRPAPAHYPAPDLNFQIIQYARFAVPVALAEPEFAVIYAAAWPTWLAAQELRQRTGRPLVLHVAELAATADETLETATGWIAELQRQALHRADLIMTETPALAQRLRHELGREAARVQAIPAADTAAIARALHAAHERLAG